MLNSIPPWTYQERDGVRYDPKDRDELMRITLAAPEDSTHWKLVWGEPQWVGHKLLTRATTEYTGDLVTISFGGGWMPLLPVQTVSSSND